MDKDTSHTRVPNGQVINRRNIRVGDKEKSEEDIIGNSEEVNANLPAGTNICVHAHSQLDKIFYFIHNSNSDHQLWEYDVNDESFRLLLQDDILNFQVGQIIQCRYIGDMLYWTDGWFFKFITNTLTGLDSYNPPRKLNIEKSALYQSSGGTDPDGYSTMTARHMDMIKWPPDFKPATEYQTDSNRKSNELYQKLFQFTYRYVYDDHEVSTWTQYSKIILPDNHEGIDGRRYNSPESDNKIQVTVQTGPEIVKKIQIAVRVGNDGTFGIFKTIDKDDDGLSDNTPLNVDFYGDEAVEIVPNTDLRNYDTLPQTAALIESVEGNTIVLGNGYEGYDKVDLDSSITPTYRRVFTDSDFEMKVFLFKRWTLVTPVLGDSSQNFWAPTDDDAAVEKCYIMVDSADLPDANLILSFPYVDDDNNATVLFYETVAEDASDVDSFGQNLASAIDDQVDPTVTWVASPGVTSWNPTGMGYVLINSYGSDMITGSFTENGSDPTDGAPGTEGDEHFNNWSDDNHITATKTGRFRAWKWGAHHPIGIQYTDRAKRDGTVNTNDSMRSYVPFPSEVDLATEGVTSNSPYLNVLRFEINHQPPEWAKYYHFVYQGNSRVLSFQQRMAVKLEAHNINRVLVSLDSDYENIYSGVDIVHDIKKGDVVRFITTKANSSNPLPLPYLTDYVEFSVLEYLPDGGENGSEAVVIEQFNYDTILGGNEAVLVEIYTPRDRDEEAIWFELGDDYKILNAHTATRAHQGMGRKNADVFSITAATSTIIVSDDFGFLVDGGSITITNSSDGNNGTYTVATVLYNVSTNATTITVDESLTADEIIGTASLATCQQDQDFQNSIPARGYLEEGDVYYRERPQETGFTVDNQIVNCWVQDFSFSDYYISNWYNKGRPAVFDVNARRLLRKGLLRNSQTYIDKTLINGLSTFYALDQVQLQENFGGLYGIVQTGQTLKYFQEEKVGSVYINQEEITNADGSKQLITTNKVLGTVRPHEEPYGCKDTLAIVKVDRDVFFYDREKSVMVVATPGGLVPVSDEANMRTWFRDKKNDFVANTRVQMVHDRRNKEVVIIFSTPSEAMTYSNRDALGFSYDDKMFTSFYDLGVEMLVGASDDRLFSFKEGKLYKQDSGTVRELFGSEVEGEIQFVFNENPHQSKVLKGIEMDCTKAVVLDEISIPETPDAPNGMNSRIKAGRFKKSEGLLSANYLRDENDPRFTSTALARVNGREMRGLLALHKILISGDQATRMNLKSIIITYVESKRP